MTETLAMTVPQPTAPAAPRGVRRVLLDSGYALTSLLFAVPAFVLAVMLLSAGAGTLVVVGGVLLLSLAVQVARGFARFERLRMRGMLGLRAPSPAYLCPRPGDGFWRRMLLPLRDVQAWLDVVWCVVGFVTALIGSILVLVWWATALGGLTYWFWQRFIPYDPDDNVTLASLIGLGDGRDVESLLMLAIGAFALLTLPLAARLAASVHSGLAWLMLCGRADLQQEVARVTGTRDAARLAEAESLRRLERDIHDGPQQRLVRLTMDLGRARQQVSGDPEKAATIIDDAVRQAREATEELRSLSRGIAPPLLVDRGLAAAVEEMAAGCPVPVTTTVEVPAELPPHVETAAYFVVAEALTNVAKHSGARAARVAIIAQDGALDVVVTDDGVGGAHPGKGLGLAGLGQRVAAVDGDLDVTSPAGGPTTVRARIPIGRSAS